MKSIKRS